MIRNISNYVINLDYEFVGEKNIGGERELGMTGSSRFGDTKIN
jgi:hypothetical protein